MFRCCYFLREANVASARHRNPFKPVISGELPRLSTLDTFIRSSFVHTRARACVCTCTYVRMQTGIDIIVPVSNPHSFRAFGTSRLVCNYKLFFPCRVRYYTNVILVVLRAPHILSVSFCLCVSARCTFMHIQDSVLRSSPRFRISHFGLPCRTCFCKTP